MSTTTEPAMRITEGACRVLTDINDQTYAAHVAWKRIDDEGVLEMSLSATKATCQLFGLWGDSGGSVSRDGELSLYVSTRALVFGVIFHPKHYRVKAPEFDIPRLPGCKAVYEGVFCLASPANEGGPQRCGAPYGYNNEPTCTGHIPLPFVMPMLGTWSFHS